MKFLVPGETTRADVLLRFGDPIQRLEEDRYFLYHWKTIQGYWLIPPGETEPSEDIHYLCLEFTHENTLKRWKYFKGGFVLSHPEKQVIEWMKDETVHKK